MESKLNYLFWMLFNGGGGRDLEGLGMVLITSNPSFLILPSWRDLEGV